MFKVGDVVECVSNSNNSWLTIGEEYVVLREYVGADRILHKVGDCEYVSDACNFKLSKKQPAICEENMIDSDALSREYNYTNGFTRGGNTKPIDTHYNYYYQLTQADIQAGKIKVDAYFVSQQWKLGSKDETGALFHCLKTITRFGEKNPVEREITALYKQVKRLAELNGVELK